MLRIHFTDRDIARVRIAREPDPLWEVVLGLQQLHPSHLGSLAHATWRRKAHEQLRRQGVNGAVALLNDLVPLKGYFPDFLTPAAAEAGLDEGLAAVAATPRAQLSAELAYAARTRALPSWLRHLAHGDRATLEQVGAALRAVHDTVVRPGWAMVSDHVTADVAVRLRAFADGGAEGALASLRPVLHWEPPVLWADYPSRYGDLDVHLDGRGLRLVPSFFCWGTPVVLADLALPPVVVYPVRHSSEFLTRADRRDTLAALLGGTRSRVLSALVSPSSTRELASRLALSPSSASEHTGVLRNAGLVSTSREGQRVVHRLTALGEAVLTGEL